MTDLFSLDGRVGVVTGGGGRLGSRFAEGLVAAGAQVVLAGRQQERLDAVVEKLGKDRAAGVSTDVADAASVAALFEEAEQRFGGVDVVVNSAAIATDEPLGEVTAAGLERVLAVNVVGAVFCTQSAAPIMRRRGGGKIVNIGSIYGTVAPDSRLYEGTDMVRASPSYVASKSALVNLTRDLAARLAPSNIQVNMLSPGGVDAGQPAPFRERYVARTPAGRMTTPDDSTGTLVYLSSSASDYVTGQNIHVDGGFTVW